MAPFRFQRKCWRLWRTGVSSARATSSMPSWQNSWKGIEQKCSKSFAFSLVLKLIRNDHDEIEEAFSPSNANCVCPIEIFLFVCAENRILISLSAELRILKCQCSDERCVQTGWIEQSMETCSVFSPLIRYLGVSTCFYLYHLFVYILYFLHCFVFICTLFVFLFCCSIWMNKAINRSLFHFSVTVDLLDCV